MTNAELIHILFTGIGEANYDIDDLGLGPLTVVQETIVDYARDVHSRLRALVHLK